MTGKTQKLSKEALGNKAFTYTAAVSQEADGTFELVLATASKSGKQSAADPTPQRPPFRAPDLATLGTQVQTFLRQWEADQPESKNQVLCCTKVAENALARAQAKLEALARPPVRIAYGR